MPRGSVALINQNHKKISSEVRTYDSATDAAFATDREGRVVFLNPVAQTLTSRTIVEAAGRRLEEVFVVVNETSRAKVQNPLRRCFTQARSPDSRITQC